jgi:hypothetical protein
MANPVATNVKEVFAAMPTRFNAGAAKGLKAVYQFDLTGDNDGKLNPQMAFMSGKLKIAGDMGLAMKMQQLFPMS